MAKLDAEGLRTYLRGCSVCLARAHARTGDAAAISGYLGNGDVFVKAVSRFAGGNTDQTILDHLALVDAVESGPIVAEIGV